MLSDLVSFLNATQPTTAAERFALTLDDLCRVVAARIAGVAMADEMAAAMILLVWGWMRRIVRKILELSTRSHEGRIGTTLAQALAECRLKNATLVIVNFDRLRRMWWSRSSGQLGGPDKLIPIS